MRQPRFYDVRTIAAMARAWMDDNPGLTTSHWLPTRPTSASVAPRWQLAWWVLTGQADALLWKDFYKSQADQQNGRSG